MRFAALAGVLAAAVVTTACGSEATPLVIQGFTFVTVADNVCTPGADATEVLADTEAAYATDKKTGVITPIATTPGGLVGIKVLNNMLPALAQLPVPDPAEKRTNVSDVEITSENIQVYAADGKTQIGKLVNVPATFEVLAGVMSTAIITALPDMSQLDPATLAQAKMGALNLVASIQLLGHTATGASISSNTASISVIFGQGRIGAPVCTTTPPTMGTPPVVTGPSPSYLTPGICGPGFLVAYECRATM